MFPMCILSFSFYLQILAYFVVLRKCNLSGLKENILHFLQRVMSNGSLYLHIHVVKEGYSPDPNSESYSEHAAINQSRSE